MVPKKDVCGQYWPKIDNTAATCVARRCCCCCYALSMEPEPVLVVPVEVSHHSLFHSAVILFFEVASQIKMKRK